MTPLASNIGFSWWSHDIGGFSGAGASEDNYWHTEEPELFLRWLQFASFAPIFRTHCRYCNQLIWTWGNESGVEWLPVRKTNSQKHIIVLLMAGSSSWWHLLQVYLRPDDLAILCFIFLHGQLMRATMVQRSALIPYIYSHAYSETFLNGRGLLTPLYWDDEIVDPATGAIDPSSPAFSPMCARAYLLTC